MKPEAEPPSLRELKWRLMELEDAIYRLARSKVSAMSAAIYREHVKEAEKFQTEKKEIELKIRYHGIDYEKYLTELEKANEVRN